MRRATVDDHQEPEQLRVPDFVPPTLRPGPMIRFERVTGCRDIFAEELQAHDWIRKWERATDGWGPWRYIEEMVEQGGPVTVHWAGGDVEAIPAGALYSRYTGTGTPPKAGAA
jgi:hypothetical protein